MSLVGTRPILQDELRQYELHHRARIAIKPGMVCCMAYQSYFLSYLLLQLKLLLTQYVSADVHTGEFMQYRRISQKAMILRYCPLSFVLFLHQSSQRIIQTRSDQQKKEKEQVYRNLQIKQDCQYTKVQVNLYITVIRNMKKYAENQTV